MSESGLVSAGEEEITAKATAFEEQAAASIATAKLSASGDLEKAKTHVEAFVSSLVKKFDLLENEVVAFVKAHL